MTTTLSRRLILGLAAAALLLVAAPAPAPADRAVPGYTLKTVTAGDCTAISITRQSDGEGGTVIVVSLTFEILDATGAPRDSVTVSTQLTPAQRTSLGNFVTSVGVPLANAAANL